MSLVLSAAPAAADESGARRRFSACAGGAALAPMDRVSWSRQQSRIGDHKRLREDLHVPLPEGKQRLLFWSHRDNSYTDYSLVAVRDAKGRWRVSGVGIMDVGMGEAGMGRLQDVDRLLSVEAGRALDRALADPCLHSSPTYQAYRYPAPNNEIATLEIEAGGRSRVASWTVAGTPQQEAVLDLLRKE